MFAKLVASLGEKTANYLEQLAITAEKQKSNF